MSNNETTTWSLIQYPKDQDSTKEVSGNIIIENQDNPNGFLERIILEDEYVYGIQYRKPGKIPCEIKIGTFYQDRERNKKNAEIAENVKIIIDKIRSIEKLQIP